MGMELVEDRNGLRKEGRRPVDLSEESGYLRAFLAGERHNLTYRISGARAEAGRSVGRLLTWYSPQVEVARHRAAAEGGMRGSGCWCASSVVHIQLDKRASIDPRLLGEKDHGIYLFKKGSRLLGGLCSQCRVHIFNPSSRN